MVIAYESESLDKPSSPYFVVAAWEAVEKGLVACYIDALKNISNPLETRQSWMIPTQAWA